MITAQGIAAAPGPGFGTLNGATTADRAIDALSSDNDVEYCPTVQQLADLNAGFDRMRAAGARLTDDALWLITAGDQDIADEWGARFDGYETVRSTLQQIFGEGQ